MSSIRDFWIREIRETEEFKALANTEDIDLGVLENNLIDLLDDQFITTATETGIARREALLNIMPKGDDSLETRRDRVAFKWDNQLPYTYTKLAQQLQALAPDSFEMVLNNGAYTLTVTLELNSSGFVDAVQGVCEEMVPANVVISVQLRYNTYEVLSNFTHTNLSTYTHTGLRESVII